VVGVFFISTCLLTLIMVLIWHTNIALALCFITVFGVIEGAYFSSVLSKVVDGGWVPLAIATCFMTIMYTWHYGTRMKSLFELSHKLSMDWVLGLGHNLGISRVPGIGLVYTELPHGVPAIFAHFITNLPAIHSTLIFVCIRHIAVSTVPEDERILMRRIGPRRFRMYRCAVRYGYTDHMDSDAERSFEESLLSSLRRFIITEAAENTPATLTSSGSGDVSTGKGELSDTTETDNSETPHIHSKAEGDDDAYTDDELTFLQKSKESGVVYLLGDTDVHCKKDAFFIKKIAIDYIYSFLRRNCRKNTLYLSIPQPKLLKVGMTYYV
jgi:KUP system potassium uptake protein